MRTLWSALSFVAIVHMLALIGLIGWLYGTERLDWTRIETARSVFAAPITEAQVAEEAATKDRHQDLLRQLEEERARQPLPPSVEQVARLNRLDDQAAEIRRRAEVEIEQLASQLEYDRRRLAAERLAFEQERAAWQQATQSDAEKSSNEQFQRVLRLLADIPPKQAKDILLDWVRAQNVDQAVSYLNALPPRAAAKVLREFKTDEERGLAGELLERIEALGTLPDAASETPDGSTPG